MTQREHMEAALRREVLEEAGYACAIPVCRVATTEVAHIVPYRQVKEHTFDNLIALCPNHHTMYDQEKKIPRASILRYKANLAVLNGRYSDMERRLLEDAVRPRRNPATQELIYEPETRRWTVHRGMSLLLAHLVADGIVRQVHDVRDALKPGMPGTEETYMLTEKGMEFVRQWRDAEPLLE